jgi:hypothetical protein
MARQRCIGTSRHRPRQIGLAHRQRQFAVVVGVTGQHVEGIELHLMSCEYFHASGGHIGDFARLLGALLGGLVPTGSSL